MDTTSRAGITTRSPTKRKRPDVMALVSDDKSLQCPEMRPRKRAVIWVWANGPNGAQARSACFGESRWYCLSWGAKVDNPRQTRYDLPTPRETTGGWLRNIDRTGTVELPGAVLFTTVYPKRNQASRLT